MRFPVSRSADIPPSRRPLARVRGADGRPPRTRRREQSGTGRARGVGAGRSERPAVIKRRRSGTDRRVERRRVLEIEKGFERAGELIAPRKVRPAIGIATERRQEALLDQGKHRGMVADLMRDVVRLRERRHGDQRNAKAELIETGAILGEWPVGLAANAGQSAAAVATLFPAGFT